MESLIHADIFFFVCTIVIIIIGVLSAIVLVYVLRILADVRAVSETFRSKFNKLANIFNKNHPL